MPVNGSSLLKAIASGRTTLVAIRFPVAVRRMGHQHHLSRSEVLGFLTKSHPSHLDEWAASQVASPLRGRRILASRLRWCVAPSSSRLHHGLAG
jgi:hypothetical protein